MRRRNTKADGRPIAGSGRAAALAGALASEKGKCLSFGEIRAAATKAAIRKWRRRYEAMSFKHTA